MLMNLLGARGLPSDHRHMPGFGVDTYRWLNEQGEFVLVEYAGPPAPGVRACGPTR